MPAFLEDISRFYGTGEKNREGQTLEEFLEAYDPYKYKNPSATTDTVVFSYRDRVEKDLKGLKVLLVKRSNHPSIGFWALPGGFANLRENLDDTARRELEEETGVEGIPVERFACYGDYDRDPRARVITTAYMALTDEKNVKVKAGDDAADAAWCTVTCTEEAEKESPEWVVKQYVLRVDNEDRQIHTRALVEKKERKGLIRERKYRVIDGGVIAVDHAAIIVQAMELLRQRVEEVQ